MLKKVNRLTNFKTNINKQDYDSPLFKIKTFTEGEGVARFGFVVSKKVDKSAVVRNKTKRVLKSVIKKLLPEVKKGKKIIVIAKTKLDFNQEEQLEAVVRRVFKKADLTK